MRVTLAYPYDGHQPDDTVDLPDHDALNLLRDGRARLPTSQTGAAGGSVDDIKTYVGDDPDRARQALDAELARKTPRRSLLDHLKTLTT